MTRDINQAFDQVSRGLRDRFNLGPFLILHRDLEFKRALAILHDYTDTVITEAMKEKQKVSGADAIEQHERGSRLVFLNELIKEIGDKKTMRDLLLSAVSGGRDTTGALLSHIFYYLCRNQSTLEKLRDEISQLGGEAPTYEQMKDLKYLRWVVDESEFPGLTTSIFTDIQL